MADVKIIIEMASGDVEVRPLRIVGDFAVHNALVGNVETLFYTVTHIPSGWAVRTGIERLASAADLATRCGSVAEWGLLDVAALRAQRWRAVAAQESVPKALRSKMGNVIQEWLASQ